MKKLLILLFLSGFILAKQEDGREKTWSSNVLRVLKPAWRIVPAVGAWYGTGLFIDRMRERDIFREMPDPRFVDRERRMLPEGPTSVREREWRKRIVQTASAVIMGLYPEKLVDSILNNCLNITHNAMARVLIYT